MRNLIQLDMVD